MASRLIFVTCMLFMAPQASATNWVMFMGANKGLFAAGGTEDYGKTEVSFTYGITPSSIPGRLITQLNLNSDFSVVEYKQWTYRLGVGAHLNVSPKTFLLLPDQYPEGYYPQNAIFFAFNQSIKWGKFSVELSVLDYYFEVLGRNIGLGWQLSSSFSIGFGFEIEGSH